MRETSEMADSAEVRKKEGRRGPDGKGSKENEGREGDEKRTAVVRGYHELHNSWPSHNRAAQGCERADGMSFSFVSSRGDYFSFHSFFAPLVAPSLSFSRRFSLQLTYFISLCVARSSLAIVSFLLVPALSFVHVARLRLIGASRAQQAS